MRDENISGTLWPLEAPNGWFLHKMEHQHTDVRYVGDIHEPLPHADGAWMVQFQKYPNGGYLIEARGHSMSEAWINASKKVMEHEKNGGW